MSTYPIIQSQSMEKFELDLVNDLVKEAIEALCKRKRWQDTFRHIIKQKDSIQIGPLIIEQRLDLC